MNKEVNQLNKKFKSTKGSGTTLTNIEIKDIIKAINSLENRGFLLKGTTLENRIIVPLSNINF